MTPAPWAPGLIGTDACRDAHNGAQRICAHGHCVTLMSPQVVKPSITSHTHAMADVEAIAEAMTRPTMRFVLAKKLTQPHIQARHEVRERLGNARTALINETHGWLGEDGIVLPHGVVKVLSDFPRCVARDLMAEHMV
jgi:transposase